MQELLVKSLGSSRGFASLKFPVSKNAYARNDAKTLFIIAADNSGSMCGRAWTQVQDALIEVVKDGFLLPHVMVEVVVYNHEANILPLTKDNFEATIRSLRADGRTCFAKAFKSIMRIIDQHKARVPRTFDEIVVAFFTDGCDTSDESPDVAMGLLGRALQVAPSRVNCVGFTKEHNYKFLEKLRQIGTTEGVFRYAEAQDGPDALRSKLEEIFDIVTLVAPAVELSIKDMGALKFMQAEPTSAAVEMDMATLEMWIEVPLEAKLNDTFDIHIQLKKTGDEFLVPLKLVVANGATRQALLFDVKSCEMEIDELAVRVMDSLTRNSEKEMATFYEILSSTQACLKEMNVYGAKRLDRDERVDILESRQRVQTKLDALHSLLAQSVHASLDKTDKTSLLARANDIRFTGKFSKARRQRMMDQRVARNRSEADGVEDQLKFLSKDLPSLKMTESSLDLFMCTLSQLNLEELMQESHMDVLGFGLALKRTEYVVDAPTLIRVCNISSTFVSKSSMEDAIKYSISVEGPLRTHGGFDVENEMGVAVRGRSREPINAWLPLYVCKPHWDRVKLMLRPILGYFCTLDALGFDDKQFDCLFKVLGVMISKTGVPGTGERELLLLFAFQRMCFQVAVDFGLLDTIFHKVSAFASSMEGRSRDVLADLSVIIGYLSILPSPMVEKIDMKKFWMGFLSESLRRSVDTLLHSRSDATTTEIANMLVYGSADLKTSSMDAVDDAKLDCFLRAHATPFVEDRQAGKTNSTPFEGWVFDFHKDSTEQQVLSSSTTDALTSAPSTSTPSSSQLSEKVTSSASTSFKMPKKEILTGLANYGRSLADALPGPHIKEKADAATKLVAEWWSSLLPSICSLSPEEQAFFPEVVPEVMRRGSLEIIQQIEKQLSRVAYPTFSSIQNALNFMSAWSELLKVSGDSIWNLMDSNCGLAPDFWLEKTKEKVRTETVPTLVGIVSSIMEPENLVSTLKASLLQAVLFHSNKVARTAMNDGRMKEMDGSLQLSIEVLETYHKNVIEMKETALEKLRLYQRWQHCNHIMTMANDIWVFIGLLSKTHSDRDQGFMDLVEMLKNKDSAIPLHAAKIEILLSGRFEDRIVFCRGNPWIPERAYKQAFVLALGEDVYMEIDLKLRSSRSVHWYRDSDIPNRHGHCNSNPHLAWCCKKCKVSGYNK